MLSYFHAEIPEEFICDGGALTPPRLSFSIRLFFLKRVATNFSHSLHPEEIRKNAIVIF